MNTSNVVLLHNSSIHNVTTNAKNVLTRQVPLAFSMVTLFIYSAVILSNGTLLLPFVFKRSLRNPFSVYVINLSSVNFLRLIIQSYLGVLAQTNPTSSLPFNRNFCHFFLYTTTVLGTGAINMHGLIAVNRLWAILHPLSYRSIHSTRFAVLSCVVLWTYANLVIGMHPLVERLQQKTPNLNLTCGQSLGTVSRAVVITSFATYLVPLVVALLPFPVMLCTMFRRERKSAGSSVQPAAMVVTNDTVPLPNPIIVAASLERPVALVTNPTGRIRSLNDRTKAKQIFLGMLTASIIVCYVPFFVFYALQIFVPNLLNYNWLVGLQLLFQSQAIMDPLLFVLMLRDLRLALCRYCCKCV